MIDLSGYYRKIFNLGDNLALHAIGSLQGTLYQVLKPVLLNLLVGPWENARENSCPRLSQGSLRKPGEEI